MCRWKMYTCKYITHQRMSKGVKAESRWVSLDKMGRSSFSHPPRANADSEACPSHKQATNEQVATRAISYNQLSSINLIEILQISK